MVRTMPSDPWRCADFLERVRPGFAVSVALHIGLFLLLAYFLAFHSPMPVTDPDDGTITVIEIPKAPPPKPIEISKTTIVKPMESKPIKGVIVRVPPIPLPPVDNTDSTRSQTTTTAPPAETRIVNPVPIFRGGLVYPDRAAEAGREGYVDFDFIILPDGTVGDPRVVAEIPDNLGFAAAAKKAFPKWKFKPMLKDGVPIAAPARIRVSFKLS